MRWLNAGSLWPFGAQLVLMFPMFPRFSKPTRRTASDTPDSGCWYPILLRSFAKSCRNFNLRCRRKASRTVFVASCWGWDDAEYLPRISGVAVVWSPRDTIDDTCTPPFMRFFFISLQSRDGMAAAWTHNSGPWSIGIRSFVHLEEAIGSRWHEAD